MTTPFTTFLFKSHFDQMLTYAMTYASWQNKNSAETCQSLIGNTCRWLWFDLYTSSYWIKAPFISHLGNFASLLFGKLKTACSWIEKSTLKTRLRPGSQFCSCTCCCFDICGRVNQTNFWTGIYNYFFTPMITDWLVLAGI